MGVLKDWIDANAIAHDELLFTTRTGRRPAESNWNRSLKRAAALVCDGSLCPYDCRHACATTWLQAGVPLGEAAIRLGHSVETLVSYYVGTLQGDDLIANERISAVLEPLGDLRAHLARALPADGGQNRSNLGNGGQTATSP